MGVGASKPSLRIKPRRGRGSSDPEAIKSALLDNWEDVQSYLNQYADAEKEQVKEHFNKLFDGDYEQLGDNMFGTSDDFGAYLIELNDEDMKTFTAELLSKGAIDEAYLTSE